jgi:glycosyltransferase involved in cell wall biosynthesis
VNKNPLVSIIMTAYNREKFIGEAIESVLNNSYANYELIVVDDLSTDQTVNIVKSYLLKSEKIKFFQNEVNLGDYPNRNRGVSYANGDFICFVDSDDKLLPETIKTLVDLFAEKPDFNFAMTWQHSKDRFELSGFDAIRKHFFERNFLNIGPGETFYRKSFFESIGQYATKYGPANDMYFNLKVCTFSKINLEPFKFIYYRRHEGQELNNNYSYLYNSYNYLNDALKELNLNLSNSEVNWLIKKNKRRFIINSLKYLIKTGRLKKTIQAYQNTRMTLKDLIDGVFN